MLLSQGIAELGLTIPQHVQDNMLSFIELLQQWNRVYNLTAITKTSAMITHHLLDSLSIAPYLQGQRILDVGSGAGFPGIPLAMAFPEKTFVLLDSRGKKTRFLQQAVMQCKLTHVTVVQVRMEQFTTETCFDVIIGRAVGSMVEVVEKTKHLLNQGGYWLMMKGGYPTEELAHVTTPYVVHPLLVPGLNARRHVVVITPS